MLWLLKTLWLALRAGCLDYWTTWFERLERFGEASPRQMHTLTVISLGFFVFLHTQCPLLRALWSLLGGICGVLKGSAGCWFNLI